MDEKVTDIREKMDERDAHKYRLLQARELIARFRVAVGREPSSVDELEAWLRDPNRKPAA